MLNNVDIVTCTSHIQAAVKKTLRDWFLCWSNSPELFFFYHSRGWTGLSAGDVPERENAHRRRWSAGQHPRGTPAAPSPLWADTCRCWPGRFRPVPLRRRRVPVTRAPSLTAPRPGRSQRTTLQREERERSRSDEDLDLVIQEHGFCSCPSVRCYMILLSSLFKLAGCSCLWRACSVQDWLWLHFGETEPSGFLWTGARSWWSAGCSG